MCRKHFFCLTFDTSSIGGYEKSWFLTGMPSWPGLSGLGGRRQEKCDTGTLGEETTYKKTKCEKSFLQIFLVFLSRMFFFIRVAIENVLQASIIPRTRITHFGLNCEEIFVLLKFSFIFAVAKY